MDMLKKFFPISFKYADTVANLIIGILIYLVGGAIAGTIAALLYRGIVTIHYSNKVVLKRSMMHTYKILITNGAVFAIVMMVFFVDTFNNISFLKLLFNGIVHSIWIVALYLVANYIFNKSAFKTLFELYRGRKV